MSGASSSRSVTEADRWSIAALGARARLELDDQNTSFRGMSPEQTAVLVRLYGRRMQLARESVEWTGHASPLVRAAFAASQDEENGRDFRRRFAPLKQGVNGEANDEIQHAMECGQRLQEIDALIRVSLEGDRTTYVLQQQQQGANDDARAISWIDYHKRVVVGRPRRRNQCIAKSDEFVFSPTIFYAAIGKEEEEKRSAEIIGDDDEEEESEEAEEEEEATSPTLSSLPLNVNDGGGQAGAIPIPPPPPPHDPAIRGDYQRPRLAGIWHHGWEKDIPVGALHPLLRRDMESQAALAHAQRDKDAHRTGVVQQTIKAQFLARKDRFVQPLVPLEGEFRWTFDATWPDRVISPFRNIRQRYQLDLREDKALAKEAADAFPKATNDAYGGDITFWQPDSMIGFAALDFNRPPSYYSWEFARRLAMAGDPLASKQFRILVEYWLRIDRKLDAWESTARTLNLDTREDGDIDPHTYVKDEEADARRRLDLESVLAYGRSGDSGGTMFLAMDNIDDTCFYHCLGLDKMTVDGQRLDRAFFGTADDPSSGFRPTFATSLGDYLTDKGVKKREAAVVGSKYTLRGIRPFPGGWEKEGLEQRLQEGEYNSLWWAQLKPRRQNPTTFGNYWWKAQMKWRWLRRSNTDGAIYARTLAIGGVITTATLGALPAISALGLVPSQTMAIFLTSIAAQLSGLSMAVGMMGAAYYDLAFPVTAALDLLADISRSLVRPVSAITRVYLDRLWLGKESTGTARYQRIADEKARLEKAREESRQYIEESVSVQTGKPRRSITPNEERLAQWVPNFGRAKATYWRLLRTSVSGETEASALAQFKSGLDANKDKLGPELARSLRDANSTAEVAFLLRQAWSLMTTPEPAPAPAPPPPATEPAVEPAPAEPSPGTAAEYFVKKFGDGATYVFKTVGDGVVQLVEKVYPTSSESAPPQPPYDPTPRNNWMEANQSIPILLPLWRQVVSAANPVIGYEVDDALHMSSTLRDPLSAKLGTSSVLPTFFGNGTQPLAQLEPIEAQIPFLRQFASPQAEGARQGARAKDAEPEASVGRLTNQDRLTAILIEQEQDKPRPAIPSAFNVSTARQARYEELIATEKSETLRQEAANVPINELVMEAAQFEVFLREILTSKEQVRIQTMGRTMTVAQLLALSPSSNTSLGAMFTALRDDPLGTGTQAVLRIFIIPDPFKLKEVDAMVATTQEALTAIYGFSLLADSLATWIENGRYWPTAKIDPHGGIARWGERIGRIRTLIVENLPSNIRLYSNAAIIAAWFWPYALGPTSGDLAGTYARMMPYMVGVFGAGYAFIQQWVEREAAQASLEELQERALNKGLSSSWRGLAWRGARVFVRYLIPFIANPTAFVFGFWSAPSMAETLWRLFVGNTEVAGQFVDYLVGTSNWSLLQGLATGSTSVAAYLRAIFDPIVALGRYFPDLSDLWSGAAWTNFTLARLTSFFWTTTAEGVTTYNVANSAFLVGLILLLAGRVLYFAPPTLSRKNVLLALRNVVFESRLGPYFSHYWMVFQRIYDQVWNEFWFAESVVRSDVGSTVPKTMKAVMNGEAALAVERPISMKEEDDGTPEEPTLLGILLLPYWRLEGPIGVGPDAPIPPPEPMIEDIHRVMEEAKVRGENPAPIPAPSEPAKEKKEKKDEIPLRSTLLDNREKSNETEAGAARNTPPTRSSTPLVDALRSPRPEPLRRQVLVRAHLAGAVTRASQLPAIARPPSALEQRHWPALPLQAMSTAELARYDAREDDDDVVLLDDVLY